MKSGSFAFEPHNANPQANAEALTAAGRNLESRQLATDVPPLCLTRAANGNDGFPLAYMLRCADPRLCDLRVTPRLSLIRNDSSETLLANGAKLWFSDPAEGAVHLTMMSWTGCATTLHTDRTHENRRLGHIKEPNPWIQERLVPGGQILCAA